MQNSTSSTTAGDHGSQSESDFLKSQADAARQAITDTLDRLRNDLKQSADVAAWTRQHPWPTLGVAAAVGFLAASAIGGKRRRNDLAELLAEALNERGAETAAERTKPSVFSNLMNEVIRNVAGTLQGVVASAVSAKMQQASEPTTNGHEQYPADAV